MADEEHHADQIEYPHEDAEGADELKRSCGAPVQFNQSTEYCGVAMVPASLSRVPMHRRHGCWREEDLVLSKISSEHQNSLNRKFAHRVN